MSFFCLRRASRRVLPKAKRKSRILAHTARPKRYVAKKHGGPHPTTNFSNSDNPNKNAVILAEEHDSNIPSLVDEQRLLRWKEVPQDDAICEGNDLALTPSVRGHPNSSIVKCWEPQPSPCCAAASVAGAFNALWDMGNECPHRVSFREVAEIMASQLKAECCMRQAQLEQCLGIRSDELNELDEQIEEWIQHPVFANQARTKNVLEQLLETRAQPLTLIERRIRTGGNDPHAGMDWLNEMAILLSKRQGVKRLRLEKPYTSAIGSSGISLALEALARSRSLDDMLKTSLLMSASAQPDVDIPIRQGDDTCAKSVQWNALIAAIDAPRTALIFHLTNHYALIYAWREWMSPTGLQRQILTARRGQRPSAWISFEEVGNILMGENKYNIIKVHRVDRQLQ